MKLVSSHNTTRFNKSTTYFIFYEKETGQFHVKVKVLDELWTRRMTCGNVYVPIYSLKRAQEFVRSLTT